MREVRGNDVAMIFQDPMTSLNPTMTIGRQIAEPVRLHKQRLQAGGDGAGARGARARRDAPPGGAAQLRTHTSSQAASANA